MGLGEKKSKLRHPNIGRLTSKKGVNISLLYDCTELTQLTHSPWMPMDAQCFFQVLDPNRLLLQSVGNHHFHILRASGFWLRLEGWCHLPRIHILGNT